MKEAQKLPFSITHPDVGDVTGGPDGVGEDQKHIEQDQRAIRVLQKFGVGGLPSQNVKSSSEFENANLKFYWGV